MIIKKKFAIVFVCLLATFFVGCNLINEPEPLPTLAPIAQLPEPVSTIEAEPSQNSESDTVATELPPTPTPGASELSINGRIAYFDNSGEGIYLLDPSGSEEQNPILNLSQNSRYLGTTPDKQLIAFQTPTGLLFTSGGNDATKYEIPNFNNISWIQWSTNSERFALISNGNLFVSNKNGTDIIQLSKELELDNIPGNISWSPDGKYIVFICNQNASEICIAQSFGEEAVVSLINNDDTTWYREPSWAPDGSRISFVAPDNQGNLQIFSVDTVGEDLVQLTEGTNHNSLHAWSPDSQNIAFASMSDTSSQAVVMKADGSDKQVIFQGESAVNGISPLWLSEDKIGIYYTQTSSPEVFSVAISNINGSEMIRFTENAKWAEWSPDGSQLAFLSSDNQLEIASASSTESSRTIEIDNGSELFIWLP